MVSCGVDVFWVFVGWVGRLGGDDGLRKPRDAANGDGVEEESRDPVGVPNACEPDVVVAVLGSGVDFVAVFGWDLGS